jgi:hypothetical protein
MKNRWQKGIVDELKLESSEKTRELKGEAAELECYRDGDKVWERAVAELRREIEEIENKLKGLR